MTRLDRRQLLAAGLGAGALAVAASAADSPPAAPAAKFRLGLVTYNLAANWDVRTILKVMQDTGLAAVEFRTTHKHGVEPKMSKAERKELKQRFADSGLVISGCG